MISPEGVEYKTIKKIARLHDESALAELYECTSIFFLYPLQMDLVVIAPCISLYLCGTLLFLSCVYVCVFFLQ